MVLFDPEHQSTWPVGDGEMAVLVRNHDWSQSSLGPIGLWPQSLRTLVDICLAYPVPCAIVCGEDGVLIYNDACAHLQGDAHPGAFGAAATDAFPAALSDVGPIQPRLLRGEALIFCKRPWVSQRAGVLTTGHYDATFTPVRDESGKFTHAFAVVFDAGVGQISGPPQPAKRAATPDALWILDVGRMRLSYASPALDTLLREDRSKVQADFRRWLDMVHPDDLEAVQAHLADAADGTTPVTQYRIIRPSDASIVLVRHTSYRLEDADGATGQLIGLVQDVTELERANAALLEEKERYRVLAEGVPPLVWRSSMEGLWTWAGQRWLDYTGQTQEQSHGWGWLDAVHPDDRQSTMEAWHQARPHGMLDATFRLRRASDGSWRWFQTRSMPRRAESRPGEPDGDIIEWLGSSSDIDDLMQLQARQAALIADLQHRTESLRGVIRTLGGTMPRGQTANDVGANGQDGVAESYPR